MSSPSPASPGKKVRFHVKRQDGPGKPAYWEAFDVDQRPGANVISCLLAFAGHPVNTHGRTVTPIVWDCNCLEEICGACTMVINGKPRQSCSALIDAMVREGFGVEGKPITLEPLSKFPIVRDLWVDRSRMFEDLKKIKAWVPLDSLTPLGPGQPESPQRQDVRYNLSKCMTCGCCLEACPQYTAENDFIGAAAISQARYFNRRDTTLAGDRTDALMGPGGISDCGNAQNCVEVCPKEIPLTESIAEMGQATTVRAVTKFFGLA